MCASPDFHLCGHRKERRVQSSDIRENVAIHRAADMHTVHERIENQGAYVLGVDSRTSDDVHAISAELHDMPQLLPRCLVREPLLPRGEQSVAAEGDDILDGGLVVAHEVEGAVEGELHVTRQLPHNRHSFFVDVPVGIVDSNNDSWRN